MGLACCRFAGINDIHPGDDSVLPHIGTFSPCQATRAKLVSIGKAGCTWQFA